jgi:hypothetical protein
MYPNYRKHIFFVASRLFIGEGGNASMKFTQNAVQGEVL